MGVCVRVGEWIFVEEGGGVWVCGKGRNLYPRLIIDVSTDFHKMLLKNQK